MPEIFGDAANRLIDHQGLSYTDLAGQLDKETSAKLKQQENDDPMSWVWESYQISSKLYPEIEKSNNLGEDYYKKSYRAGGRASGTCGLGLASVLNALFKNTALPAHAASDLVTEKPAAPVRIEANEVAKYIGKTVRLTGKVFSHSDKGSFVLVNVGGEYPNQPLTVWPRGETKSLADNIDGKMISVTGKIIDYKGRPEIEVKNAGDITIK